MSDANPPGIAQRHMPIALNEAAKQGCNVSHIGYRSLYQKQLTYILLFPRFKTQKYKGKKKKIRTAN